MIKNLLITYLFLITNVFAGLPPTTVKGQAEAVKTTTFNLEVPYSQATTTAAGTRLLEVGNNNILANGSFEHSTYDTGWTCSLGTKTKETTTVFKGKNSMKIVSAGAGTRCYNYSTTDAAKLKGQQGHATVRVNSTDSVLQVCALAGGTTSAFDTNCVTVPVTTTDAPWKTVVIPTIMDGTGNGVVIKSAETLTKTVFVDEVEYKHGLPVQSVNGARLIGTLSYSQNSNCIWSTSSTSYVSYSADSDCLTPTATGEIIAPSTKIPGFQLNHKPGTYYIVVNGFFYQSGPQGSAYYRLTDGTTAAQSQACYGATTGCPMISGHFTYTTSGTRTIQIQGAVETASQVTTVYTSGANRDLSFSVYYFPPESTIYSQASRDFGYTNAGTITIGATTTAPTKGTVVTDRVWASRDGQRLLAEYQYEQSTAGTAGSGDYLFTLPNGLSFDSTIVSFYTGEAGGTNGLTSASAQKSLVGYGHIGTGGTARGQCSLFAYSSTRFRAVCVNPFSNYQTASSGFYSLGNSTNGFSFKVVAPIQGWTDSGVIVGSFQGYNETPGTSRVETFSVSYGETVNAICDGTGLVNTNQCAYLDQIGNAVANVTRVGLGEYTVNTVRNYSKLKCVLIMGNPVTFTTTYIINSTSNTFSFTTTNASTKIDTYGTIMCQGIPQ